MLEYRLPGASCRPAQPSARAWGRYAGLYAVLPEAIAWRALFAAPTSLSPRPAGISSVRRDDRDRFVDHSRCHSAAGAAPHQQHDGGCGQMRRTTTAEVRVDEGKATSSGTARRPTDHVGCSRVPHPDRMRQTTTAGCCHGRPKTRQWR
jgi:hypothetical protein